MRKIAAAGLILVLLLSSGGAGPADAYEELQGSFVARGACPALDSIRRGSNPGNATLLPGRSYTVRALNRPDGAYLHLEVPGAAPPLRWVHRACGELRTAAPPRAGEGGLHPFFDGTAGPSAPSPAPPQLGPFDRAVLRLCGDWGSRPAAADFRRMLDDPDLAPEVTAIHAALDGRVAGGRRAPAAFRDELTDAWFRRDGFIHIFCGEPGRHGLGGLHFAGRYLQMQERGWGGIASACDRTEIAPPVYTFGVRYRIPGGGFATACPKGYAANLDAAGLIVETVKAFRALRPSPEGKAACLHRVAEPGERAYLAVFVARDGAILSFYPDASPACDGGGRPESCLCGEAG